MSHRTLVLLVVLALLAACERSPQLLSPDLRDGPPQPSPDFVDGSVGGGNPHFFFLPPIAEREPEFDGIFNPALRPSVDVCVLDGGRCAEPQPDGFPLRFTMDGEGSGAVRLVEGDEHYILNWHTRGLDPGRLYRLAVFPVVDGTELGHVDLEPVGGREQPREGFMPLHIGRTVPVKFRIETGILCEGENDCVEEVVGPAGGTVITPSGFAGADFPEGALEDDVVVAIDRITPTESDPCLPTDLEQAEGCYRFQTDPGPTTFAVPVTAGVCLDPQVRDRPEHDQFQLHKFSPERPENGVVALPNVAALFINCEGFASLAFDEDAGLLTRLVTSGFDLVDPLARFLGPQQLGAADIGFGGELIEFSRIGWARPLAIEIVAGDGQEGVAGTTLSVDPAVRVTAAHVLPGESRPPVAGVPVTFSVLSGGGSVSASEVDTDSEGVAHVAWTLGSDPGENVLRIGIPGDNSVFLTAQGTGGSSWSIVVEEVSGEPSTGLAVNDLGHVLIGEGVDHYIWNGVSRLPVDIPGRIAGFNTNRQVVSWVSSFNQSAIFLWAPETGSRQLVLPDGWRVLSVSDLNDRGQIVGSMGTSESGIGFVWSPEEGFQLIGELDHRFGSGALAINELGEVAGWAGILDEFFLGSDRAVVWTPSTGLLNLGTLNLDPFTYSIATDINDSGMVIGESDVTFFTWSSETGMREIQGAPPGFEPDALNNEGHMIGAGDGGRNPLFVTRQDETLELPDLGARPFGESVARCTATGLSEMVQRTVYVSGSCVAATGDDSFEDHAVRWVLTRN